MALQIWEIFNFIPGVLGGFFSSPCATPVLVVLLLLWQKREACYGGYCLYVFLGFKNNMLRREMIW